MNTSASIWNFAGSEPEFASCASRLFMLNGDPARTARCDVLHGETGDLTHSAWVNGHRLSWSDWDAVIAEAWLGILPTCANCRAPYRGDNPYCGARCALADKQISRDYEAVEAA